MSNISKAADVADLVHDGQSQHGADARHVLEQREFRPAVGHRLQLGFDGGNLLGEQRDTFQLQQGLGLRERVLQQSFDLFLVQRLDVGQTQIADAVLIQEIPDAPILGRTHRHQVPAMPQQIAGRTMFGGIDVRGGDHACSQQSGEGQRIAAIRLHFCRADRR